MNKRTTITKTITKPPRDLYGLVYYHTPLQKNGEMQPDVYA